MNATLRYKKLLAISFIILLGAFLTYALLPYINAFFGAFVLFVVFQPIYLLLTNKLKIWKGLSAVGIILMSLLIVITPLVFLVTKAFAQLSEIVQNSSIFSNSLNHAETLILKFNIGGNFEKIISEITNFVSGLLISAVQQVGHLFLIFFIMFFILYFLLTQSENFEWYFEQVLPFNKTNSKRLIYKLERITKSIILVTSLIAIFQGTLLGVGFKFFGVPGALLWGFVGALASFLPIIGLAIVWVPIGLIFLLQQNFFVGVGILVWGLFLSNIDNLIRPILQQKVGSIHPLISVLGLLVGIPFFGLLGFIIGPLLVSYFLQTIKMFKEEYL